jgi:hypothetical protein
LGRGATPPVLAAIPNFIVKERCRSNPVKPSQTQSNHKKWFDPKNSMPPMSHLHGNASESRSLEKILATDFTDFTDGNLFIRVIRTIRGSIPWIAARRVVSLSFSLNFT